jgi:homogentisate 1,2-dioxygenase
MSYYFKLGQIPHKRHTQFRQPDGSLYHEELMGLRGFSGAKSLLYHLRPPTEVSNIAGSCPADLSFADAGPVQHRLLNTAGHRRAMPQGRIPLMANQDVNSVDRQTARADADWYRYAHGDEAIFVHEGTGTLESQFGTLRHVCDYLVIPTGVIWRILLSRALTSACSSSRAAADTSSRPTLRQSAWPAETAPYAERDIRPPDSLVPHDEKGEFEVRVKARGRIARYVHPHHPLDVVGWDGHLWPFAFNIRDFEPITGRVHQPPPVHQTFEGPGFVVCSFVPRLFDYHPLAIPAPYNHSNVDSDEVIYYVEGDFMSRRGVASASLTHPNGFRMARIPEPTKARLARRGPRSLPSWSIRSVR